MDELAPMYAYVYMYVYLFKCMDLDIDTDMYCIVTYRIVLRCFVVFCVVLFLSCYVCFIVHLNVSGASYFCFHSYLSKISFAFPLEMEKIVEAATPWLASAFCLAQENKSGGTSVGLSCWCPCSLCGSCHLLLLLVSNALYAL